nr:uncharacterized protein LOC109730084 isoform X3 [Microcebus murinus]
MATLSGQLRLGPTCWLAPCSSRIHIGLGIIHPSRLASCSHSSGDVNIPRCCCICGLRLQETPRVTDSGLTGLERTLCWRHSVIPGSCTHTPGEPQVAWSPHSWAQVGGGRARLQTFPTFLPKMSKLSLGETTAGTHSRTHSWCSVDPGRTRLWRQCRCPKPKPGQPRSG